MKTRGIQSGLCFGQLQFNFVCPLLLTVKSVYLANFVYHRYNQLSAVPASLANCTKIDEFNIEGNNVSELPVSIILLLSHVQIILQVVTRGVTMALLLLYNFY